MLDYVMLQHLPGSIYSDSIYRCPSCGQGPVMAGDGFLMNRCLNCGRYQHATDLGGLDFSWIRTRGLRLWQRVKKWLLPREIRDVAGFSESVGGAK
jgi:hypothetical protein